MVREAPGSVLGAFLRSDVGSCATALVGARDPLRGLAVAANVGTPRGIGAPATEGRSADPRPSRGLGEAARHQHRSRRMSNPAGLATSHTPARDEPPLAHGARVPLPIRHATTSHRGMESRRGLFGITTFGVRRRELGPGPYADASGCRAGRPTSGPLWRAHERRAALPSPPPQQGREGDDPRPEPLLYAHQRPPSAHSP